MANDILYLKIDANILVHQNTLAVKDIAQVSCSNTALKNKILTLKLTNLQLPKPGRYVKSILDVLDPIQEAFPQVTIENLGESDFILTYEAPNPPNRFLTCCKTTFVSLLSFAGASFSIMTFHNDVDITSLFSDLYQLFTGQTSDGFTVLELSYSFGLGIGILLFFNHFAGKRIQTDPTPLDVQMHTYEQDVNQTIMANWHRD